MTNTDLRPIIHELAGAKCACGARKVRGQTFCKSDYFRLPKGMRERLYDQVGHGYVEAYNAACAHLKLTPASK